MKNSLGRTVPNQGEGVARIRPVRRRLRDPRRGPSLRAAVEISFSRNDQAHRLPRGRLPGHSGPERHDPFLPSSLPERRQGPQPGSGNRREARPEGSQDRGELGIFPVHEPLIGHINRGTVAALDTNYMSGPVAQAISYGILANPVMMAAAAEGPVPSSAEACTST